MVRVAHDHGFVRSDDHLLSVASVCLGRPGHPAGLAGAEALLGDAQRRVHPSPHVLDPDLIGQLDEAVGEVLHFDRASTTLLNTGSGTNRPRAYATATEVAPGQVLVVGGIDYGDRGFVLATCDLVVEGGVFGSATYATTVRFPTGMADHTATRLADGRVLFVGGLAVGGGPAYAAAYVYRHP